MKRLKYGCRTSIAVDAIGACGSVTFSSEKTNNQSVLSEEKRINTVKSYKNLIRTHKDIYQKQFVVDIG